VDRMFVRSMNCMLKPQGLSEAVRGFASRLRPKAAGGIGRASRPFLSFARYGIAAFSPRYSHSPSTCRNGAYIHPTPPSVSTAYQ
jgi:hypothetical protein